MKNGIVRRITALLLTMVCVVTAMPEALLTTYADEIQVLETEVLEEEQSEVEEAAYTEQTETVTEKSESTEQTEIVTDNTENAEQLEESTQLETNMQEIETTEKEVISETEILSEAETEVVLVKCTPLSRQNF